MERNKFATNAVTAHGITIPDTAVTVAAGFRRDTLERTESAFRMGPDTCTSGTDRCNRFDYTLSASALVAKLENKLATLESELFAELVSGALSGHPVDRTLSATRRRALESRIIRTERSLVSLRKVTNRKDNGR